MNPTVHTVAAGETLSSIASQYGVNYQDIAKANNIVNPNLIYPGQSFTIPGATPGSVPAPQAPQTSQTQQAPQPTSQPQTSTGAGGGGGTPPPYAPNTVNQTVDFNGVTWKGNPGTGWTAQSQTGGGQLQNGSTGAPTFDLVAATNAAYNTPEITAANQSVTDAQNELNTRQQARDTALANEADNPFYSEATLEGKQKKISDAFNNDAIVIQNKISQAQGQVASLKADAAIKVNAAQGQYNINEQAYQQNLTNFNNLISQGALDNASGTDVANLAVQTGIPTSMIQGIIDASKKKDNPVNLVQATVGNDLQLIAVDSNGDVVNTTTIPGAGAQTKATGKGKTDENGLTPEDYQNYLANDIKNKITLKSLVQKYLGKGGLTIDNIYQSYAQNSPWGAPKETLAEVKAGKYLD